MTINADNVVITTTAEEGTDLVTRDADGQVISTVPLPPDRVNAKSLAAKIDTAIAGNVTWLGAHATRQTAIDALKSDATAGKTATVANVAQAQAAVRQLSDMVLRAATGLDNLEARLMDVTKQLTGIERTVVGRHDSTDGT
jgi:hypothetical protein